MLKRHWRIANRRDERGVSIVIVALAMVALLIFVAFAIDVGGVYNQRRQSQTSSDSAALAAAQDLPNVSAAQNTAVSYVNNDLFGGSATLTLSDFQNATYCAGITPPSSASSYSGATWSPSANTCLATDSSGSLIWAAIPKKVPYKTVFGQVAGRTSIDVSAGAVAGRLPIGLGGVLPFVSTGAPGQACIKAQGGTTTCPPTTGNFGYAHFDQYGNPTIPTTPDCSSGSTQEAPNMALGVDHLLSTYSGTEVDDGCGTLSPNSTKTETGTTVNDFDKGMLTGGSFGSGRLARISRDGSGSYYQNTANVNGVSANDVPLWDFIPDTTVSGIPYSCQRQRFKDILSANPSDDAGTMAQMTTCFNDYETTGCGGVPCTSVLFGNATGPATSPVDTFDIQRSSRFSYVPDICESGDACSLPSGSKIVHFYKFVPIYIQTLFFQGGKAGSFDPGVGQKGTFGTHAASITGWVIDGNMLPGHLGDPGAPFELGANQVVELLR